jgi:adhesin transport system outer membrane protein
VSLNSELSTSQVQRPGLAGGLYGRSATLRADQLIFDGFRTPRMIDAADADWGAAAADYRTEANAVLFAAVQAYLHVLRDRELLEAAKRFLDEHHKSIARVTEIASHDPGKQFDLVQLQMRASMAASFVTEREGALAASEGRFGEIVGHRPGALTKPGRLQLRSFASLPAALEAAERGHPAVAAAAERLRRRRAEREQAGGALLPRLDLSARYARGWDRQGLAGQNDEAYAGLLASYALSTGRAQFTALRAAELQEASADERLQAAKRDVREGVRVAWAQREALQRTVPLSRDYLKRAFEVVDGYEAQYTFGRRGVLELLLIRNEIYTSESRLLTLTFEQLAADYALAAQMGLLYEQFARAAAPGAGPTPRPTPAPAGQPAWVQTPEPTSEPTPEPTMPAASPAPKLPLPAATRAPRTPSPAATPTPRPTSPAATPASGRAPLVPKAEPTPLWPAPVPLQLGPTPEPEPLGPTPLPDPAG